MGGPSSFRNLEIINIIKIFFNRWIDRWLNRWIKGWINRWIDG